MPIFDLLKSRHSPDNLPYHVVVPSLPGYAFSSGPPTDKKFGIPEAVKLLNQLMNMLSFGDGYVAHGGDIGSKVARSLAATSPSCKGRTSPRSRLPPYHAFM